MPALGNFSFVAHFGIYHMVLSTPVSIYVLASISPLFVFSSFFFSFLFFPSLPFSPFLPFSSSLLFPAFLPLSFPSCPLLSSPLPLFLFLPSFFFLLKKLGQELLKLHLQQAYQGSLGLKILV